MKSVICLFVVLAINAQVFARPQYPSEQSAQAAQAAITKYEYNNNDDGGYSYSWSSSDGISREEVAEVINAGTDEAYLVVRGFYSYPGPDGKIYSVGYSSYPESGFEAEGEHLPPSAGVKKQPSLGIPSAALASLAGGGLGK